MRLFGLCVGFETVWIKKKYFNQGEKSVILAHYTSIKKSVQKKDYYANKAAGQEQNFCIINSLLETLWLSTEELFFWHFYGTSFKSIPGSLGSTLLVKDNINTFQNWDSIWKKKIRLTFDRWKPVVFTVSSLAPVFRDMWENLERIC